MNKTKIEFGVQMTCDSCVDAVKKSLIGNGIEKIDINLEKGSVVVETTLPTLDIQKRIESTGRKVVIKGYGGNTAGVAILDTGEPKVRGVVRFVQINPQTCLIDGTIDGLKPGNHRLEVHECGDLSQGCHSVGKIYNPQDNTAQNRLYGDLGSIEAQNDGRAQFRIEDNIVDLSTIIGRSLVIRDGSTSDKRLACGIIARSAGLFENPKTICACDGITIWNEKIDPKNSN